MKNIFIMGKAGSGKDTVADIITNKYMHQQLTFADNIRYEYGRFFPNQNPRTDRDKLIQIGETYKTLYGKDVWVRLLEEDMATLPNQYVVTDGRHQIEYDRFVTELHFMPIFVSCPDEIRYARLMARDGMLQEEALKKECQDLWNADYYILDNSGTLEQLENRIKRLVNLEGR